MTDKKGSIVINNELTDPLGDYVFDYLLSQTKETSFHDFKLTVDISKNSSDFPKIIKDVYAFSNYGGGFLILGVKQNDHSDDNIKGNFIKTGLPEDFHLEQASLQEKTNSYLETPIGIGYSEFSREIDGKQKRFGLIYIPPSPKILIPKEDGKYKIGDKEKIAFIKGETYTRRGTQSIPASKYEIKHMEERVKNEKYRLSILSGEPDSVEEVLYGNIFEVKNIPKYVYTGITKYSSFTEVIDALREKFPQTPHFNLKYRPYEDKIISFQNLEDRENILHDLVHKDSIKKEPITNWLDNGPKEMIIISLMNKEVTDAGRRQGMRFDDKTKKLYYITTSESRSEFWPSRYKGVQSKQVAKRLWAEQVKKQVYAHAAFRPTIIKIHNKFYLKINLTMMITEDGRKPERGLMMGTIITRSSYNKYNKQQLNNILFWINKLGDGKDVVVMDDFIISNEPVQTTINTGILWDIPTMDLKKFIEEYESVEEEEEVEEVQEHEL